eukprot:g725.t1
MPKRKLPRHVVVACQKVKSRKRYGVKMKLGNFQLRIGSRFADVKSAKLVAESFRKVAILSRESADKANLFRIDADALAKCEGKLHVFARWGSASNVVSLKCFLTMWFAEFREKYGGEGKTKSEKKRVALIEKDLPEESRALGKRKRITMEQEAKPLKNVWNGIDCSVPAYGENEEEASDINSLLSDYAKSSGSWSGNSPSSFDIFDSNHNLSFQLPASPLVLPSVDTSLYPTNYESIL